MGNDLGRDLFVHRDGGIGLNVDHDLRLHAGEGKCNFFRRAPLCRLRLSSGR
jgi:hypothetical protein